MTFYRAWNGMESLKDFLKVYDEMECTKYLKAVSGELFPAGTIEAVELLLEILGDSPEILGETNAVRALLDKAKGDNK